MGAPRTRPGRHVEDSGLGRATDEVAGDDVSKRAQTVAVECGADDASVREDETSRPVPRLDQPGVEAIEVAPLRFELDVPWPGGRHEHREGMAGVAPSPHEQLERVVEHPRVGALLLEHRPVQVERDRRIALEPRRDGPNHTELDLVIDQDT